MPQLRVGQYLQRSHHQKSVQFLFCHGLWRVPGCQPNLLTIHQSCPTSRPSTARVWGKLGGQQISFITPLTHSLGPGMGQVPHLSVLQSSGIFGAVFNVTKSWLENVDWRSCVGGWGVMFCENGIPLSILARNVVSFFHPPRDEKFIRKFWG